MFTRSGWVLTLSTRTKDGILSRLLSRDGYWPWVLKLGMLFLLDWDGYWHYDPWFFMLFRTVMGITIFQGLWPKLIFYHFLGNDEYFLVYVILYYYVSLIIWQDYILFFLFFFVLWVWWIWAVWKRIRLYMM
jgi:hypothetical protein